MTTLRIGLLAALVVGCTPAVQPLPSTLCYESPRRAAGSEVSSTSATEAEWIDLLTSRDEGRIRGCELSLAELRTRLRSCRAPEVAATRWSETPAHLIAHEARVGDDEVVWVATEVAAEQGLSRGPIALVRRTELGLEVQALGVHEGSTEHVSLRVLHPAGAVVVVIESERSGIRFADLLVQASGALVHAAVEGDRCAPPAHVAIRREAQERAGSWTTHTVVTTGIDDRDGWLWLREHQSVRELDPADPDAPPRAAYDVDRSSRYRIRGERLELAATTAAPAR